MSHSSLRRSIRRLFGTGVSISSFTQVERLLLDNDPAVPMTPQEQEASLLRLRDHQALVAPRSAAKARALEAHDAGN